MDTSKPIVFTNHARLRMVERDATENEIEETIRSTRWQSADFGRLTSAKRFDFRKKHKGKYYDFKDVVPVFIEEEMRILVITVYTFFS